jgi:predicted transcriptional regulator
MLPSGKEFRYLRKKAGLTQTKVAEEAGLSQSLIARIERGDIDTRLSTAEKILGVIRRAESTKSRSLEVGGYMVSPVIYCKSDDPIKGVVAMMEDNEISQMPVMEGGVAVGSVTDTQLVQILAKRGARAARKRAGDMMQKPFPQLDMGSPIDKAISLLGKNSAVLVMRGGHIAGIITKADVLKMML